MKLTKKLIPALGMLVLSASMLVTSTFAWFSMNTKASVTGMQVTAITDQVFLQITAHEGSFTDGAVQDTVTDTPANDKKYGAVNVYANTAGGAYAGGTGFTWLTTSASAVDKADKDTDVDFSEVDIKNYAYVKEFDLRLDPTMDAANTANAAAPLKVDSVELASTYTQALSKAVSVLVVCEDSIYGGYSMLWKQKDGEFELVTGSNATVTKSNFPGQGVVVTIKVYVFFDGENDYCTTNNALAAKDVPFAVNIYFSIND